MGANDSDRISWYVLAAVLCVFFLVFFSPFNGAGFDPVGYYSYLSSFLFDGDVDIENDWALSHNGYEVIAGKLGVIGPKGLVANEYAIGSALLWLPFYLPVRIAAWSLNLIFHTPPAWTHDRYSAPYVMAVSFGTVCYGLLALVLIFATCRMQYTRLISLLATLGAAFASPLPRYLCCEPAMSHVQSAFTVALLVYLSFRHRNFPRLDSYLILAGTLALATLVRWQNILFGVIPAAFWLEHMCHRENRRGFRKEIGLLFGAGLVFAGIVSIQMAYWWAQLGTPLTIPQGQSYMAWTAPKIGKLLFSGWHGLYYAHPLLLAATAGLCVYWFQNRRSLSPYGLILALALMTYVNAAVIDWFAAGSFGNRRFCSSIPLFAVGLAAFWNPFRDRLRWIPIGVTVAAIGWNMILLAAHRRGIFDAFYYGEMWALRQDLIAILPGWLPTIPLDSYVGASLALNNDYFRGITVAAVAFLLTGTVLLFIRMKGFLFFERNGTTVAIAAAVAVLISSALMVALSPPPDEAGKLLSTILLPKEPVSHETRQETIKRILRFDNPNPMAHISAFWILKDKRAVADSFEAVYTEYPEFWATWVLTLPPTRTTERQRRKAESLRTVAGRSARLAFVQRIHECSREGRERDERRWLRRSLRYDPFDFAAVLRLSEIYSSSGRYDRSRTYRLRLRNFLEAKTRSCLANENKVGRWRTVLFQLWYMDHFFSLARLYEENGEWEKARETWAAILQRKPYDRRVANVPARKLLLDFVLDDSDSVANGALARLPRQSVSQDTLLRVAELAVGRKKPGKALKILQIGFAHYPDSYAVLNRLRELLDAYSAKDVPFEDLLSAEFRSALYWSCTADYLSRAGRLRDALDVLKREFSHSPRDPTLAFCLSQVLQQREVSEIPFDNLLSADLSSMDYWLRVVEQLNRAERYGEALKILERPSLQRPENAWIHHVRGVALLGLERLPEAEAAFRRAFDLSPGYPTYGMFLCRTLLKQGRHDEARKVVDLTVRSCEDKSQLEYWKREIESIKNAAPPAP